MDMLTSLEQKIQQPEVQQVRLAPITPLIDLGKVTVDEGRTALGSCNTAGSTTDFR